MPDPAAVARKQVLDTAVDVAIRLTVIGVVVVWCGRIFRPFLMPVMWGAIIAVALGPAFGKLAGLTGGRRGLTAAVFTLLVIALIAVPTYKLSDSVVRSTIALDRKIEEGSLTVPTPRENVKSWPLIGERVYAAWSRAHTDLTEAIEQYRPQIRAARAWALDKARGVAGALLTTIVALVIAAVMLTYASGATERARSVAARLGGAYGEGLVSITAATIRSVAQGVLGVALLQATAAGLGLVLAGIPGWGIWTVMVLALAVVQLPPLVVLAPIAIWYFSAADSTVAAILFLVWSLIVSVSDGFLKPLFLGRGVNVPMPVILIGAIGGVMLHGIIGLFVGAVVFAIGYELFRAWMADQSGAATVTRTS